MSDCPQDQPSPFPPPTADASPKKAPGVFSNPLAFSEFLRDVTDLSRGSHLRDSDLKAGFLYREADLRKVDGVSMNNCSDGVMVHVPKPGNSPVPPISPEEPQEPVEDAPDDVVEKYLAELDRYESELISYRAAKEVYDAAKRQHLALTSLYTDLFNMSRAAGGNEELVIGLASLVSDQSGVRRSIVVVKAQPDVDVDTGAIDVVAEAPAKLELGWLPQEFSSDLKGAHARGPLEDLLASFCARGDAQSVKTALEAVENSLGLKYKPGSGTEIRLEMVLLSRKKQSMAVPELLDDMVKYFGAGGSPSAPLRDFLGEPSIPAPLEGGRVHLPLPASKVQQQIAEHALTRPVTVVQGPPGTGKTYTIANTAAALIAEGKRVLVTSQQANPLLEVQSKLPPALQPLLLPILGKESRGKLTAAANGLLEGVQNFKLNTPPSTEYFEAQIQELENRRTQVADTLHKLHLSAAYELEPDSAIFSGFGLEGMTLARLLDKAFEDRRAEWCGPKGFLGESGVVTQTVADDFLKAHGSLRPASLSLLQFGFPQHIDAVTQPAEFASLVTSVTKELEGCLELGPNDLRGFALAVESLRSIADWSLPAASLPLPEVNTSFPHLRSNMASVSLEDINRWSSSIATAYRSTSKVITLLEEDLSDLLLESVVRLSDGYDITPETRELANEASGLEFSPEPHDSVEISSDVPLEKIRREADALLSFLQGGGSWKKMIGQPKEVKAASTLLTTVKVNGDLISTTEALIIAREAIVSRSNMNRARQWASGANFTGLEFNLAGNETRVKTLVEQVQTVEQSATEIVGILFDLKCVLPDMGLLAKESLLNDLLGLKRRLGVFASGVTTEDSEADLGAAYDNMKAAMDSLPQEWVSFLESQPSGVIRPSHLHKCLYICQVLAKHNIKEYIGLPVSPQTIRATSEQILSDSKRADLEAKLQSFASETATRIAEACGGNMSPASKALYDAAAAGSAVGYQNAWPDFFRDFSDWSVASDYRTHLEVIREEIPRLAAELEAGNAAAFESLGNVHDALLFRDDFLRVLREVEKLDQAENLLEELDGISKDIRKHKEELVETRCWRAATERISGHESVLGALETAAGAITKTKTAKTYQPKLRALRDAMYACREVVPGMVVPLEEFAEYIGFLKEEERFDVVIVDESSQLMFPAVFLFALANQVIVVGDNYQTSPKALQKLDVEIQNTAARHLGGNGRAGLFTTEFSLYDLASTMTAPFFLQEHFRCPPEVISLSNKLCYEQAGRSLVPMKTESASENPVYYHRVRDPYRSPGGPNTPEIDLLLQVLMEEVDLDLSSSMGIVVVGSDSAAHIKELQLRVLEKVGPEEQSRRDIQVGTASQFQGSERDIMFLSLLDVAPEGGTLLLRPLELSGRNRKYVQELNVAVSRAKERLHIFHSFNPSTDLKPGDARQAIFDQSGIQVTGTYDAEQLAKCDSKFEKDVFAAVRKRLPTAEILTQVPTAGFRIDMTVSYNGNIIAVECDGDAWHTGYEQVMRDYDRQSVLESLGWKFVRFLGSEWYAPDGADHQLNRIEEALSGAATMPAPRRKVTFASRAATAARAVERLGDSGALKESANDPTPAASSAVEEVDVPVSWEPPVIGSALATDLPEKAPPARKPEPAPVSVQEEGPAPSPEASRKEDMADAMRAAAKATKFFEENGFWPEVRLLGQRGGNGQPGVDARSDTSLKRKPSVTAKAKDASSKNSASGQDSAPSKPMSLKKATNRELAAALRDVGKEPRGATWENAKKLLDSGFSVVDAAARA